MSETFDESYPPSLFIPPAPPVVVPTGATAGTPGAWVPANATAPETLAEANALGLSLGPAWAAGSWVDLGNTDNAHWSGTAFAAGVAPAVQEETQEQTRKRGRPRKAEDSDG